MTKPMETLYDLLEEAKIRTVWWALSIFAICYFLSHTSKSMWTNLPIAVLLLSALRILSHKVEFHWRVQPLRKRTYLTHLEKKQLSVDDPRLTNAPPSSKWKRKIGSPVVEAAVDDFLNKLLKDFVVDLWYSTITPDREASQQMNLLITDILGEIAGRVKEINLVDLLTRDVVDLIGDHLELYRRNQSAIGVEVMGTLSFEERDERLKHHLMASKELHPALISPECEYKVLQRLMGGLVAVVLRPREAQSPLVRTIARELLTCLVMQPIMNLACPGYINELIEYIILNFEDDRGGEVVGDQSAGTSSHSHDHSVTKEAALSSELNSKSTSKHRNDVPFAKFSNDGETSMSTLRHDHGDPVQSQPADWARVLEAATQRRTEVLAPENLENMWTKGRNYKTKNGNRVKGGTVPSSVKKSSGGNSSLPIRNSGKETSSNSDRNRVATQDKPLTPLLLTSSLDSQPSHEFYSKTNSSRSLNNSISCEAVCHIDKMEDQKYQSEYGNKTQLKRSSSTSALKVQEHNEKAFAGEGDRVIFSEEFYTPDFGRYKEEQIVSTVSNTLFSTDGLLHVTKLKCRVVGAYFEKTGSKSFAVYSIAVTDVDNKTWFVKRRYRNFERLHRHLKDIPNYTLHLPPKRFLSSSIDDSFVHQRCIQLDRYLQDLLSIANVAEQHEVWDFLSASSKNYSFGKSTSVMKALAVNVDDAMDDILRQFKGVSGGIMRKVAASPSLSFPASQSISNRNSSWSEEESNKNGSSQHEMETTNSLSDNEEHNLDRGPNNEEVGSDVRVNGWHSDNELNSKGFPPRVINRDEDSRGFRSERNQHSEVTSERTGLNHYPAATSKTTSELVDDPGRMPPEWTPSNVSVPLLNLVDTVFQLNRRGWLRRQVFWISKQILQLMMEDAIDDWLLRQIHLLRREDVIALGIRWIQDVLWPNGTFFLKLEISGSKMVDTDTNQRLTHLADNSPGNQSSKPGSFQLQLEAARRASDVKKMIFDGAPSALVSLIGNKQYKRCARDVYYFLQSNICLKQLAYGLLELILVTIFPELRDVIRDVHEKMRDQLI